MPPSDVGGGRSASAQMFQDSFASYLATLRDRPDREVVPVAYSAAKDLVVMIAERDPSPTVRAALVEISALCQHMLIAVDRSVESVLD